MTAGTVAVSQSMHHRHPTGPPASVVVTRSINSGLDNAINGTSLVGSVGAGPGLTAGPLVKAAARSLTRVKLAGLTPSTGAVAPTSTDPVHQTAAATTRKVKAVVPKTISTSDSSSVVVTPPVTTLPASTVASTSTSTGGVSPVAPTTTTTPGATISTPVTTAPATTTPPTETSTGTSTSPTSTSPVNTSTGTSTSPTSTSPTGTSTAPTGTSTAPAGTTTAPAASTSTAPADTTTATTPALP